MTFEEIAKWIGHAHPAVTSGVYGRLSQENLNASLRGMPFMDGAREAGEALRARWVSLANIKVSFNQPEGILVGFIARPYVFDSGDRPPLREETVPPQTRSTSVSSRRRRRRPAAEGCVRWYGNSF